MFRRTKVRLTAVDRDGNEGAVTFNTISSLQLDDIISDAIARLVPAIQGIIDATIVAVRAEHAVRIETPAEPGENLSQDRLFIMWRNSDDLLATIQLPAIASGLTYVSDGRYGVIAYTDEFDDLTQFMQDWAISDKQNIPINGTVVAASLII